MDASKGRLKRDYSAEKIGGTKGRPYKPVRIPKERLTYKEDVGTKEELNNFLNKVLLCILIFLSISFIFLW